MESARARPTWALSGTSHVGSARVRPTWALSEASYWIRPSSSHVGYVGPTGARPTWALPGASHVGFARVRPTWGSPGPPERVPRGTARARSTWGSAELVPRGTARARSTWGSAEFVPRGTARARSTWGSPGPPELLPRGICSRSARDRPAREPPNAFAHVSRSSSSPASGSCPGRRAWEPPAWEPLELVPRIRICPGGCAWEPPAWEPLELAPWDSPWPSHVGSVESSHRRYSAGRPTWDCPDSRSSALLSTAQH